jgi:hypothetical protein
LKKKGMKVGEEGDEGWRRSAIDRGTFCKLREMGD